MNTLVQLPGRPPRTTTIGGLADVGLVAPGKRRVIARTGFTWVLTAELVDGSGGWWPVTARTHALIAARTAK